MKRNLVYLLLIIGLGAIAYFFVFREDSGRISSKEANFTVDEIDEITRIRLSDLTGRAISLSKKDNEWMANDSISIVPNRMRDLLEALKLQEPLQAVNWNAHDEVIRSMSSNHTKVEVYNKKGQTHCFYVAHITAPNNLTYMLNEGGKRPYIVKLPLQNIFLALRYTTDLKDWRSRNILKAKPEEIENIRVAYKDSVHYSFELTNKDGNPVISGSYTISNPLNLKRVQSYLRLWDSIYCLGYEDRNRIKDTILTEGHELATVYLKKKNKAEESLTIYFKPVTKGTKGLLEIGGKQYDFDVFIGFLNKRDMLVITRKFAQMMLRSYPEFFEADAVQIETNTN
jgi:hypothetical protein